MGYIRETTFPQAWCLLDAKTAIMKCAGFLVDLNPRRTPSPSENWHSICAGVCNCALWGPSHRRFIIKHVCVEKQEPYWAKLLTMVGDQWVTTVSTAMNLTGHGSWSSLPFLVFNHWTKQEPSSGLAALSCRVPSTGPPTNSALCTSQASLGNLGVDGWEARALLQDAISSPRLSRGDIPSVATDNSGPS